MKWLLCVAMFAACGNVQAEKFVAEVIIVIDGDTVVIPRGHGVLKVRLADIDAPEVGYAKMQQDQPFGAEAQRALSAMVLKKSVEFDSQAIDQYGRLVAHLRVDGVDVNAEQIRRGMAWAYAFHHRNRELIALQTEAQQNLRGLWASGDAIPPWQWRKQHPHFFTPDSAAHADANCAHKKRCDQMQSCDEARYYLTVCGMKNLDGNGDGVPCEKVCAARAAVK